MSCTTNSKRLRKSEIRFNNALTEIKVNQFFFSICVFIFLYSIIMFNQVRTMAFEFTVLVYAYTIFIFSILYYYGKINREYTFYYFWKLCEKELINT